MFDLIFFDKIKSYFYFCITFNYGKTSSYKNMMGFLNDSIKRKESVMKKNSRWIQKYFKYMSKEEYDEFFYGLALSYCSLYNCGHSFEFGNRIFQDYKQNNYMGNKFENSFLEYEEKVQKTIERSAFLYLQGSVKNVEYIIQRFPQLKKDGYFFGQKK